MQKELGVPETKITFNYIDNGIKLNREGDYLCTNQSIHDFVNSRTIEISSYDSPQADSKILPLETACFAHVEDKTNNYYLSVHMPFDRYEDKLHDLLYVSFTNLDPRTNSAALFNSEGKLVSFRTDFDAEKLSYGRTSWSNAFPIRIYFDFVESPRYYIIREDLIDIQGEKRLIPITIESDSLSPINLSENIGSTYIASLPTHRLDNISIPIFFEVINKKVSIKMTKPEEYTKVVEIPTEIEKFKPENLQRGDPQSFVDIPYHKFKNIIYDNAEPAVNS